MREPLRPPPEIAAPPDDAALRLGVHDLSRLEWVAQLALPLTGVRRYEIEFACEIPANLYQPGNPWDQVQQFTRLQAPSEEGALVVERDDPDELRRDTLGVAHRLKQLREKFERTCIGASALMIEALHPSLEPNLCELVGQGAALVAEMRQQLGREPTDPGRACPPAVKREWELADEFLSHRLLDLLAAAQRALDDILLAEGSRLRELQPAWTERVRALIGESLAAEMAHRRGRGLTNPRADRPQELGEFVERGSHLKKHFQDVLFLDVDAYFVDYRLRNYTGVLAAALAAAFWMAFTLLPIAPGTRAGLGLGTFAVVFAVAYALKDRVKELTRLWLAGRLTRLYGQRMVRLRLPARVDTRRQILVEASETCRGDATTIDDPVNPIGGVRRIVRLCYRMRADVHAAPPLQRGGIRSIKHIFRYDLSPIFPRLDNAVRSVPVLDEKTRRVCFADAPKQYRLPVRLKAQSDGQTVDVQGKLVVSKRGIERIE